MRVVRIPPAALVAAACALFLSHEASAQGASDLGPPISLSFDALVACARRDPLEVRALALEAVARLCEEQNARQAAAGYPRCPSRECVDTIVLRDGREPVRVEFELAFDPSLGLVELGFRLPLGPSPGGGGGGAVLRCRAPFDFLAWNGALPEAEGFFDSLLAAAPRCAK